jgi:hypothetical protein
MFFDEYLLKLFGVAYHKLHTIDHPLRHRHDILAIVTELREDPKKRSQILGWYEENAQHLGDANSAFERDVKMFMRFESIERHLERLTIAFNRVNAQGLNYIRYAVRTPGHIETAIADAICRVLQSAGPTRGMHLFSRLPFAESRLKLRSARVEGDDRPIVRKRVPTDEELALHRLNVAMREHRQVSTADKTAYIAKHLGDRARISSDDLPIESIKDFCVFIALARAAHVSERTRKTSDETPGYRIVRVEGEVTANRFLRLPRFVVEMKLLPTNGQERRR